MPSKIADEINKLRGERAATQQTYMDTLADLADDVQAINITIINLESDIKKSLSRDIKRVQGEALEAKTQSLPSSGGKLSGEIDMDGHDIVGVSDFEAEDDAVGIGFYNAAAGLTLGIDSSGNVTPQGTVDGRDLNTDGIKLDGCDTGSKNDQTGAEIKTAYEGEANAYTDTKNTKLAGIETAATADQSDAEIKVAYETNANTNVFDDTEKTKLGTCESNSKDDQTGAEIKTAYEGQANAYTDTKNTKLAGCDTGSKDDQTGAEIKTAYEGQANAYTDTKNTKLNGIETAATADQSDAEILTAIENAVTILVNDGVIVYNYGFYRYGGDVDNAGFLINQVGYLGGITRFRDVKVYDGKQAEIIFIDGSTKTTKYYGNITFNGAETVDGRDLSIDGTKLDTIATNADVTGSNPPQAHGASVHTDRTRSIFLENPYYSTGGVDSDGHNLDPDAIEILYYRGKLPADFSSIGTINVFWMYKVADGTDSWVGHFQAKYGANGEAWNNHNDQDTLNTIATVAADINDIKTYNPAGLLGSATANDIVQFQVKRVANNGSDNFANNIYILGVEIEYTADM